MPCPSAKLAAIIVEVGLCLDERVNVLRPSDLHRHCPGTALVKVTVGAVTHHGQQTSVRALRLPRSCEGNVGGVSKQLYDSVDPCCRR
jgi:hypothetical protein